MGEVWRITITDSFNKFLGKVLIFLPNLLAMVTILIVGFLIAWFIKIFLFRFLKAIQFDKVGERWGLTHLLSRGGVTYSPTNLLSRFVYWVIVLITLIMGLNALEVAVTRSLITQFFNYLPHLFAAIIVLVIGYLVAIFCGQAALIAAVNAQMESAKLISRTVQWFIIILSLTMTLYHLGIAERVIITAFSIIFGGIVLALAIAFGWGGRELAKDFLEKLHERKEEKDREQDHLSHI